MFPGKGKSNKKGFCRSFKLVKITTAICFLEGRGKILNFVRY